MKYPPDICAVLEFYGATVPASGGWRSVRCPFHGDRRPSSSVNPDEGVFACHACEVKGDAYSVVMAAEGLSFPDAKARVEEITGTAYDSADRPRRSLMSKLPAWTRNRPRKRVFA